MRFRESNGYCMVGFFQVGQVGSSFGNKLCIASTTACKPSRNSRLSPDRGAISWHRCIALSVWLSQSTSSANVPVLCNPPSAPLLLSPPRHLFFGAAEISYNAKSSTLAHPRKGAQPGGFDERDRLTALRFAPVPGRDAQPRPELRDFFSPGQNLYQNHTVEGLRICPTSASGPPTGGVAARVIHHYTLPSKGSRGEKKISASGCGPPLQAGVLVQPGILPADKPNPARPSLRDLAAGRRTRERLAADPGHQDFRRRAIGGERGVCRLEAAG